MILKLLSLSSPVAPSAKPVSPKPKELEFLLKSSKAELSKPLWLISKHRLIICSGEKLSYKLKMLKADSAELVSMAWI